MKTIDWAETAESIKQGWYTFGSIVTVFALVIGGFAAGWFLSSDDEPEQVTSSAPVSDSWNLLSEAEREFKTRMVHVRDRHPWNASEDEHDGTCEPVPLSSVAGVVDADSLREDLRPHLCLHTFRSETSAHLIHLKEPGVTYPGSHLESSWVVRDLDISIDTQEHPSE